MISLTTEFSVIVKSGLLKLASNAKAIQFYSNIQFLC
jgi:hypothetical protein